MSKKLLSANDYIDEFFKNITHINNEFDNIRFEGCIFQNCNFSETTFNQCNFYDCEFINSNISLIHIPQTIFRDVTFSDCKIVGVDWTKAHWPSIKIPGAFNFVRSILNDCIFFGIYLADSKMIECKIHSADFTEANCEELDFNLSDLSETVFHHTKLSGANFSQSINYSIHIFHNDIKNAKFSLPEAASLLNGLDIEIVD
ncbi:pentapeptide repeat-containing protein [Brenneria corticis]|uniref:Pentapeptide repeat-containing protein n=1 Tax=Brenneria corticis TaxID=2173106 RepID=A0A2U1UBA4_9GAMM|nr:pentapeptide repeat-containing protein [Brenneria sp. CFCC 11842]PWC18943.1 pentapeptide repeat-containing protein [Brenneria sp. CFCC 11842]